MEVLRLELLPPRCPLPLFVRVLGAVAIVGLGAYQGAEAGRENLGTPWFGAAAGLLIAGLILGWLARRMEVPDRVPPLILGSGRLQLPLSAISSRKAEVPVDAVDLLMLSEGPNGRLIVGAGGRMFVFPRTAFRNPRDVPVFVEELQAALAERPGGRQQLEALRRRSRDMLSFYRVRPRATWVLLALIVVVYQGQSLTSIGGKLTMIGANDPALVRDGEWWRLVFANFLHANALHLFINGLALLSLGLVVERILGTPRFLVVYLLAGLGGAVASTLLSAPHSSVGASGALFGLFGAFAYLSLRYGRDLPPGIRQTPRWWTIIIGINVAISLFHFVDGWAHLGGFVVGAVASWASFPSQEKLRVAPPVNASVLAVMVVSLGVYLAGGTVTIAKLSEPSETERILAKISRWVPTDSPDRLNEVAWHIVKDPDASDAALTEALEAATIAVERAPTRSDLIDTLATAHYRRGALAEAVKTEIRALEATDEGLSEWQRFELGVRARLSLTDPRGFRGGQLHRFLEAHRSALGRWTDAAYDVAFLRADRGSDGLVVTARATHDEDLGVLVGLRKGKRRVGLMEIRLPANRDRVLAPWPTPDHGVDLAVLGARGLSGQPVFGFIPHDEDVDELPSAR